MKHWVVLGLTLLYQPALIKSGFLVADLAVSWFFTVTVSCFVSGIVFKVFLLAMGSKIKEKELMALLADHYKGGDEQSGKDCHHRALHGDYSEQTKRHCTD